MGEGVDLIKEFKEAKPPEKTVIIVGVVAVVGVAFYLWKKGNASAAAQASAAPGSQGQVAGYPMAGSTPVLPGGVNPIYDPNGNLVAFQNPPPGGPPTPPGITPIPPQPVPPPSGTGNPANWFTNILGKIGYNAKITPGGYDTNGQRFWVGNGNSNMFYAPIGSRINYGAQGRIWLTPPGGTQQLLTGPGLTTSNTFIANTAKKAA